MTNMRMSNQDAIETLRRIQEPEAWEPQITKGAYIALDMAISALRAQDSKTRKICKTCKHDPPSKKWPCVDCDMREPADRWELQDVQDTNVGDTISRRAAIDTLEKVAELFPWKVPGNRDSYDRYNEAWNDAIGRAEIEIEKLPSAQPEWNNHTVACLLAELFDDTCACNYNDIDEWLPEKCEVIDSCPNPVGVACWEQFLKHRAERRTDECTD